MHTFAQRWKAIQQMKPAQSGKISTTLSGQRSEVHPILPPQHENGNHSGLREMPMDSEHLDAGSTMPGTTLPGHDFSRIPVHSRGERIEPKMRSSQQDAEAVRGADRIMADPGPVTTRNQHTHVFPQIRLAAALAPEGDPIHDVLVEQFRQEQGLPESPAGPSDAEIKYDLAPSASQAAATGSVVYVSFVNELPPREPDHSRSNPGPEGGADRAGYSQVTIRKRMTISWETGAAAPDGRVPLYVQSANVYFRLEDFQLFVSSDFDVGSCPYRVTLEHERSHIDAFARIFHAGRAPLVRDLEAVPVPTASAPTLVDQATVEAEQDAVADRFRAVVIANSSAIKAAQDADRATKDSPAAYALVHARCPADEWDAGLPGG